LFRPALTRSEFLQPGMRGHGPAPGPAIAEPRPDPLKPPALTVNEVREIEGFSPLPEGDPPADRADHRAAARRPPPAARRPPT
jgi:hypothetical protein